MAHRVYGGASVPAAERDASAIARWVLGQRVQKINPREMARQRVVSGLADLKRINAAIKVLESANITRAAHKRSGKTPGRPIRDYAVNPKFLAGGSRG